MILSIRHRILIPFTLITVFMTFSAMLICIELVNSFYNNQLQTQASTIVMPIEKVLHQFATKALLDHNHPNKDSSFETVMNASNQQRLYSLGTNSNGFEVIDNHSNVVFKAPFNFSGIRLPAGLANVYIQSGSKLFNVKSLSTELAFPTHATTDIVKNNNKFRRYFYNHPRIKHLYFDVDVYSQGIERKRSITLVSVIGALLFINTFIVLLFFFILKHITRSVSNLTHAASQIAKGQITTPMKVKSNDEFGLLAQSFNNMLNNVQTKTAELIYERNRSKMILAQLPDGIIVTDLNHKLLLANRAAETMLGFSTDSARGQVLIRYLKDENLQSFFTNEMENIQSSQMVRELTISNQQGEENLYQITLSPLLDSTYQKTGLITVIRNITAESQSRSLKDHFLRSVTHELRTPLTSIIGFLNILKKEMHGNLNEKQREFLSIAIFNSSMLKKLINNLLDLSMIQSGKFELVLSTFVVNDVIDRSIHQLLPTIEKKQNTIFIDYQEPNMIIKADEERFKQLLENLILNANRTTEQGKIECIVTRTLTNLTIIVKDNGVGLNKEEKFALYQAFEVNSSSKQHYNDGINIELAIVKELVQHHKGSIHLESDVDQGSTYTVIFPQSAISQDDLDVDSTSVDQFESSAHLSVTEPVIQ